MKTRGRELVETYGAGEHPPHLAEAIDRAIKAAREDGFRIGFEHAVAGGDEASKRHGIAPHLMPLVMYFGNEGDRREMIDAVHMAKPGMVTVKIPERRR
jgi:hypothetical protein